MEKELSINDILFELKNNSTELEKGPYIFKELTLKQQRQLLNSTYEAVEIPARIANIYNEYIGESVSIKDDMVKTVNIITVDKKPLLLNILRTISIGKDYYESESESENEKSTKIPYTLYEVTEADLLEKVETESIEIGNLKIQLRIPTLALDTIYNSFLINALKPFRKKKISDADFGAVTDVYQMYELMKFIESISFKGVTFFMDNLSPSDKITLLDRLPRSVSDKILDFIKKVKKSEAKALDAYNTELDQHITVDINTLFFSKSEQ